MNKPSGSPEPAAESPTTNGNAFTTTRTWSVWEIQSIIERNSIGSKDPVLRVDITDIRDRLAKFKNQAVSREPASKRIKPPATTAYCTLTIWHPSLKSYGNLVEQEKSCKIYPVTLPNNERTATVTLDEPFEVRVDQLRPRDGTPLETLKDQHYSMQLMLSAENENDQWPPMDTRTPSPKEGVSYADNRLTRFPVLVAKWGRLPEIPENAHESLLEMFAIQDATRYKPKLSLRLDMRWIEGQSPLEQANAELRATTKAEPREVEIAPSTEVNYIEWIFRTGGNVTSLKCPENLCALCHRLDGEGKRQLKPFKDLLRLFFHLKNDHTLYKFSYSLNPAPGFVGEFTITPSHEYDVRTPKKLDYREIEWVRPKEAFDMKNYLDGDETWAGGKNRRGSMSLSSRLRQELSRSKSYEHVKPVTLGPASSRAPEETPDLLKPVRQKFKVPRAPKGVKFYRQPSMRAVHEGEMLSETDDEIDEEWLLRKHADGIDSFSDITTSEKELIKVFDRHMAQEDFSSDLHGAEALYRFCRQHRKFLQQNEMLRNFNGLLVGRKEAGSITLEHIMNCNRIIHQQQQPNGDEMDVDHADSQRVITSAVKDSINYGDVKPEGAHSYGRCVHCKTYVHDPRKSVRCANARCTSPVYHLSCVSLSARLPGWCCLSCSEAAKGGPSSSTPKITLSSADQFYGNGVGGHTTNVPIDLPMRTASPPPGSAGELSEPRPPSAGNDDGYRSSEDEDAEDGVISDFDEDEDDEDDDEEKDSDYEGHQTEDGSESFTSEVHEAVELKTTKSLARVTSRSRESAPGSAL